MAGDRGSSGKAVQGSRVAGGRSHLRSSEKNGLRAVALFEALKGAVVIVAGSGLLLLLRPDAQPWAERIVAHTHLNPAKNYPRILLEAVGRGDGFYLALAAGALVYACVRFVEAYGLWRGRSWAEWFAILSGTLYLPIEALQFWRHHHLLTAGVFLLNAGAVFFLAALKWGHPKPTGERRSRPPQDG